MDFVHDPCIVVNDSVFLPLVLHYLWCLRKKTEGVQCLLSRHAKDHSYEWKTRDTGFVSYCSSYIDIVKRHTLLAIPISRLKLFQSELLLTPIKEAGCRLPFNYPIPFIRYMLQVILASYTELEERVGLIWMKMEMAALYDINVRTIN